MKKNAIGYISLACYAATVWCANYFIAHVGVQFGGAGPHLIQVWPGLYAPSGVLWVAAALALRNLVQERLGKRWSAVGILAGAALSYMIAPSLALASGGAFLASELLDMLIWSRLRTTSILVAQAASNLASDVVDSICFLWLAFGSLSLLLGQVVGKWEVTAVTVALLCFFKVGRYAKEGWDEEMRREWTIDDYYHHY